MKFDDDRLWNEKVLVLWKSVNKNPNYKNNVGSTWGPVSGSIKWSRGNLKAHEKSVGRKYEEPNVRNRQNKVNPNFKNNWISK